MTTQCPVGTVDERAARACAVLVVALAALSLREPGTILIAVLAVDFAIRGVGNRRYSPLRWVARSVVGLLGFKPKPVYAPPKRFAARIGTVLTVTATILYAVGQPTAAALVTVVLIVAASLEAVIGFCLACWVYPFIWKVRTASADNR